MHHPKAAILITGNEILSGQIHESNSYFMAKELNRMGIEVTSFAVLPDDISTIAKYVKRESPKVDYFFVCGGIGSTHDDVTRPAIANVVGKPLKLHRKFAKMLKAFYKDRLNAARLRMAMLPEGAKLIIPRKYSNAPGFQINNIYVFAGIPELLREMFATVKRGMRRLPIFSQEIPTDKREGDFADALEKIARKNPDVQIGSYPHFWKHQLGGRIIIKSRTKSALHKAAGEVRQLLRSLH